MLFLLGALAVYKTVQVINALLPRPVMPWVTVLMGVVLAIPLGFALRLDYPLVSGLAMATVAGTTHTTLRMLTYLGDMALKKSR